MKTAFLYIAISLLLTTCCRTKHGFDYSSPPQQHKTLAQMDSLRQNISFEYSVKTDTSKKDVTIYASLHNNNNDTVYFLTTTCDGDQYWLDYDTASLVLSPVMQCNTSNPILAKIQPHSIYLFQAWFSAKSAHPNLQLGFHFYDVDPPFEIDFLTWSDCAKLIRKDNNIIAGKELVVTEH